MHLRTSAPSPVGQQESKVESLESIHAARMRSNSEAGPSTHEPAQHAVAAAANDVDGDDGDAHVQYGMGEQDEESDPYSLPVSHEVALEGECSPCLVAAC